MFKVPDWEDAPKNNISFAKQPQTKSKQKKNKTKTPEQPRQVIQEKPKFKAKTKTNSKFKLVNGVKKFNRKEKHQPLNTAHTQTQENFNYKKQVNRNNDFRSNKKDLDGAFKNKNYNSDEIDDKNWRKEKYPKKSKKKINNTSTKNIPTNNSLKKNAIKPKHSLTLPDVNNKQNSNDNLHKGTDNKVIGKSSSKLNKKEILKSMLQKNYESSRNHIEISGNKLRNRMLDRLKAAKFRYLNEKLYTSSGSDAQELFQADPAAFQTYHEGYQQQVQKWPVKPLDVIVNRIQKMPKSHVIADMGCGEAELSKRVAQSVRSFDLVAAAPGVEACDMARTPLLTGSVDAAVYCLALMGTDLTQYLIEANRVLKIGGHLLIAEVESRFDKIDTFTSDVQRLGFSLKKVDETHQVFFFLEFTKVRDPPVKKGKLPTLTLKPCIYKKR